MTDPILSLIGLSKKAGRAEIGEEPVGSAARSKKARVILVASDAAASSVRRAYSFAQAGDCLCLTIPALKDDLGRSVGRTSCAMLAITDIGFADAIVKKLAVVDPEQYQAASQRLEIKAQRAAQRKREQLAHEKNLRQGKLKAKPVPTDSKANKRHEDKEASAGKRPQRRPAKPADAPRFQDSRPVKKGKGSPRKKK